MSSTALAPDRGATAKGRPHVVLLGGGFGGLYAAKELKHAPVDVTVVDRRNHHLFQPLLYQVATAALTAPDVAWPIRAILRHQENTEVLLATVTGVDPSQRRVRLQDGVLDYDYLIVATGATHAYFGHDEWAKDAPGLKSIDDAVAIRARMLLAFEGAERDTDVARRQRRLTFVVVGGGPTGVELAGALGDIARRTLARDFRHFDPKSARILLLDAGERILETYPPDLSKAAQRLLEARGVTVRTKSLVTGVDTGGVWIGSERIEADTVLWAAGVRASPVGRSLGVPLDRQGRVLVEPDLSVPGHPEIFVIGDLAAAHWGKEWVPGVAQGAIQGGKHAARNILRRIRGEPTLPFEYKDLGIMATIGRSAAVAVIGRGHFSGFIAWMMWLVIHLLNLIGFRNRFVVLFQWAWAYFTYQASARLVFERAEPAAAGPAPASPEAAPEELHTHG